MKQLIITVNALSLNDMKKLEKIKENSLFSDPECSVYVVYPEGETKCFNLGINSSVIIDLLGLDPAEYILVE